MFSPSTVSISKVMALWSHGSRKTVDFSKVTIPVLVLAYSWYTAALYWHYSLHDDLICSLVVAILRETEREFIFWTKTQIRIYGQRWNRGHKARGQGQGQKKNSRPRTALPRTDTLEAKDRNARGQGKEPRTQQASFLEKKNLQKIFSDDFQKKVFKNFFHAISKKKNAQEKIFSADLQNFNHSKKSAVLEPRTGQFLRTWGFEAKAKDFKMCP